MNTKQYEDYYSKAWDDMTDALDGYKYRDIQLLGDSAAIIAANYMQQAENEKAYQRSKPTTQVSNMMAAGMSRAGAINALNGGGSYTPAPIQAASPGTAASNVKQQDLATADSVLNGLSSISSNVQQYMQIKNQNKQFYESLKIERDKQQLERDKFEYEKKRTTQNDAYDNIIKTFQASKLQSESMSANLDYLLKEFTQDERIDAEKQKLIADKARSLADAIKNKLLSGALEDVDEETLASLLKYQAMLEMVGSIGTMSLEKAIQVLHDIKEIFVPG